MVLHPHCIGEQDMALTSTCVARREDDLCEYKRQYNEPDSRLESGLSHVRCGVGCITGGLV